MSLGDSGTGGAGPTGGTGGCGSGGSGGSALHHHHHKKLRRKRKELDALVTEDKIRRKSSSASRHDLLHHSDSDDVEFSGRSPDGGFFGKGGLLGCLPGACAVLVLLTTAVGVAAALRLLMATRKDLDALQMRLSAVEASGSELPAKFHESHVRLQQLEKNHTSLWVSLSSVSSDVKDITLKMTKLESSLKALEDRLAGAPQLSSLPKDLANVQDSVATFGSSLQDVQSALKALKEGYDQLHREVDTTSDTLSAVKSDLLQLKNDTYLPPVRGREGINRGEGVPVAAAISSLRSDVTELSSAVASVNASLTSSLSGRHSHDDDIVQNLKVEFQNSIKNLSFELKSLELAYNKTWEDNLPSQISNLSADLANVKEISSQHYSQIQTLNQSIAVVKGVEKKLEGSQLQMASGVSELKQQLQTMEEEIKVLPSTASPRQSNETRMRTREVRNAEEDLRNVSKNPRKKRSP